MSYWVLTATFTTMEAAYGIYWYERHFWFILVLHFIHFGLCLLYVWSGKLAWPSIWVLYADGSLICLKLMDWRNFSFSYDYVSLSKSNVQWLNSSKFLPRVFLFVDYGSPHQNLLLMIGVYGQKTFASLCSNDFLFNWYLMRLMKHNTVCWCFVSFVVD